MGYTAPPTVATGDFITAALWNTYVRDDIIELAARTSVGFAEALGTGTTTSTSYVTATTVAGPVVVVNVLASTRVMVAISAYVANNTGSTATFVGVDITGSATVPAAEGLGLTYQAFTGGAFIQMGGVYPLGLGGGGGSTTFAEKIKVGGASTGSVANRRLAVTPLG